MSCNRLLITFVGLLFPILSFAQSDSLSVSVTVQHDSINNTNIALATISSPNLNEIGGISIVVKLDPSDLIYSELSFSRQELDSLGYLFSDRIELPVYQPVAGDVFHLEITSMNLEGAYLPIVIIDQTY